ncbi:glycosyltransferase family 2 protein [Elioraea thermophila]|uniref:glycosyltransferase family 2 protein n=1 Tax=Elioraea thermophila TaxID=2185104 RepID=UPI000DF2341B|nr:glycosyltransferase family 2 protein [Elioraea thermophila]
MSGPRLSALVVARNEEARLPGCLASLTFADEIVVVLDRTTDRSAEIARGFGARVLEGAWEIEGDRRNAGLAACAGDWILEIDADERVPPDLAAEIRAVIAASAHDWHELPVDNWIGDRLVRHGWGGSFGTTAVPRLSRRGAKRWGRQRVHPGLEWHGSRGPRLRHALQHQVDRDISDMLRRLDRYSSARAADLLEKGDIGTLAGNLRRFVSRFFKCYVSRGGWREGGWGVLIALCAGLYPLLAHLKARLEPERHRPPSDVPAGQRHPPAGPAAGPARQPAPAA